MMKLIKVVDLKPLDGHRLWLRFSDGREGVRDFADILAEDGPMVEPLREPAFFARAFVEYGVPAWPNGFDLDAIALHQEMETAGLLSEPIGA
jgi:Protein of unknown function (DUF2442)